MYQTHAVFGELKHSKNVLHYSHKARSRVGNYWIDLVQKLGHMCGLDALSRVGTLLRDYCTYEGLRTIVG